MTKFNSTCEQILWYNNLIYYYELKNSKYEYFIIIFTIIIIKQVNL